MRSNWYFSGYSYLFSPTWFVLITYFSADCLYFSYRELFEECVMMSELDGILKKGTFKVESGHVTDDCGGGAITEWVQSVDETRKCWLDKDLLKCARIRPEGQFFTRGCQIDPQRDEDCQCTQYRFLVDSFKLERFFDYRNDVCDIDQMYADCPANNLRIGAFQLFYNLEWQKQGCAYSDTDEQFASHFFHASSDVEYYEGYLPSLSNVKDAFLDLTFPSLAHYCDCLVVKAREMIAPSQCK